MVQGVIASVEPSGAKRIQMFLKNIRSLEPSTSRRLETSNPGTLKLELMR